MCFRKHPSVKIHNLLGPEYAWCMPEPTWVHGSCEPDQKHCISKKKNGIKLISKTLLNLLLLKINKELRMCLK